MTTTKSHVVSVLGPEEAADNQWEGAAVVVGHGAKRAHRPVDATGLRAVENGRFYRMEYTYSSVSLLLRSGVGRVSAVGLDRRQLALAAALSARSARAAWAKQRGIDGGAVARRQPTIAIMLHIDGTMPPARRGAASERCAVRRRATELACTARSDTVPGKSVACATPLRVDVHSLCSGVFCGPCRVK